jgi:hypothetical protein
MKKQTITVDLESTSLCTLSGVTGGIHPGQMLVYSARQNGKSYYQKMIQKMMLNAMYNGINLKTEYAMATFGALNKPKYKFSRAKWYYADHRYEDYDDVVAWCTEHFGPRPKYPDAWTRWTPEHIDRIRFRDEKDYAWFAMRWS